MKQESKTIVPDEVLKLNPFQFSLEMLKSFRQLQDEINNLISEVQNYTTDKVTIEFLGLGFLYEDNKNNITDLISIIEMDMDFSMYSAKRSVLLETADCIAFEKEYYQNNAYKLKFINDLEKHKESLQNFVDQYKTFVNQQKEKKIDNNPENALMQFGKKL